MQTAMLKTLLLSCTVFFLFWLSPNFYYTHSWRTGSPNNNILPSTSFNSLSHDLALDPEDSKSKNAPKISIPRDTSSQSRKFNNYQHLTLESKIPFYSNRKVGIPLGNYFVKSQQEQIHHITTSPHHKITPYRVQTIVIDPGHGGRDNGCSGKKSKEKNIALSVAKKLGSIIKATYPELNIIYTRTSDRFVPLHKRAQLANSKKADLFISLHCNAIRKGAHIHGSETYVMGLHTAKENLEVTKRENESILLEESDQGYYDRFDPDSPEGHILLSSYQNAYLEQSILLATEIEKQIKRRALGKSHGVKQAGFHVLRMTAMPSVLVEMGFLTNSKDEAFMLSSKGQDAMATSIFEAFKTYKYKVERQNTPTPLASNTPPERTKAVITQPAPTRSTAPPAQKNTVEYKVQLASSLKHINVSRGKWLLVNYILEEASENNRLRYFATGFENFAQAQSAKQKLRKLGFKDAFVVAYQNGKRVQIKELKQQQTVGY